MRRIIAVCLVAVLTACEGEPQHAAANDTDRDARAATAPRQTVTPRAPATDARRNVLFVGTSLTAGYGVGASAAFPAIIQQKIDSAGLPFRVVNAGISGETSAGGLRRIDWALQQPVDVLVLELGANDGLRGIDPAELRRNLDAILTRARERHPTAGIVLVGMEAPPNLGDVYTSRFRRTFTDLARAHRTLLVPFLLEGVAAKPGFNIEDGIHPNVQGHHIVADNVWRVLGPMLQMRAHVVETTATEPAAGR
jgi:acyl-CoA thioesterase I